MEGVFTSLRVSIVACVLTGPPLSLVTYSCEDSDTSCYHSCLVHLGALGPVARMRLRLVPEYSMQVYAFRGQCLDYLIEHFLELASSCHSFTLGLNFATGECTTWLRHKLQSPLAGDDAHVPDPPADSSKLGSPLTCEVPFHELGPDAPGGMHHKPSSFSTLSQLVHDPFCSEDHPNWGVA
jgi:hypothetical protein